MMLEDEQRGRDDAREAASKAERRVGEINSELDALRGQLEQVRALWLSWNLKLILTFCLRASSSGYFKILRLNFGNIWNMLGDHRQPKRAFEYLRTKRFALVFLTILPLCHTTWIAYYS